MGVFSEPPLVGNMPIAADLDLTADVAVLGLELDALLFRSATAADQIRDVAIAAVKLVIAHVTQCLLG